MAFNCKRQFTALLRRCGINYDTHREFISIENYHLYFNDNDETVTIYCPQITYMTFTFPYATPENVMHKYHRFRHMVNTRMHFIKFSNN